MARHEENRGRQFTKRRVQLVSNPDAPEAPPVELWEVRAPRVTLAKLPAIKAEALDAIREAGISPDDALLDAPHGSGLVELVCTINDRAADSIEGLAARIYRAAAHAEAYRAHDAADAAMDALAELSELFAIFNVYRQTRDEKRRAAKSSAKRLTELENRIIVAATRLRASGRDPREIASVVARTVGVTPQHVRRTLKKSEPEQC